MRVRLTVSLFLALMALPGSPREATGTALFQTGAPAAAETLTSPPILRNASEKPGVVELDLTAAPARLELVLLNLVANAVKYSDAAKPEPFVEIVTARRAADEVEPTGGATCTICVRDNGLGIPDADQPAIFDRFFRAHAHLDQQLGVTGTGLGLAIVIDCVHALGGSIRCESRAGEGTSFFVTLPCGE